MATYVLRRLLLMIPTLIGITLLVFMLVALSPGGVGAALLASGGGLEASKAAQQQAYLEDRYGLNDPVVVQYLRWLGRVSPIKFGARDQVTPEGNLVHPPRAMSPPVLVEWWNPAGPGAVAPPDPRADDPAPRLPPELPVAERIARFRAAEAEYAAKRVAYVAANTELRKALERYATEAGLVRAFTSTNQPREAVFRRSAPRRDLPTFARVQAAGAKSIAAFDEARRARRVLEAAFAAAPFPQAGVPVIPGVLGVAWPDLGVSYTKSRPVGELIRAALPVTLLLNLIAFAIIYAIAVPSGMLAAARRGTWFDVTLGASFVALWSVPTVWAGVMALGFLASSQYLGWFPVSGLHDKSADAFAFLPSWSDVAGGAGFQRGYLLDTLWHICLPVACLVYGGFAILSKQTRAAMLDNFSADYVRTAKAKGVPRRDVVLRHVFRNSLLPLITLFVGLFPATLSGSVVIERIFTVPGMGSLIVEAINLRDREIILANTLIIAAVNLLALLLADILYAVADPRVTYE
ncbi:MAG: ABC transporter permease [Phycisphaerales bacterium]